MNSTLEQIENLLDDFSDAHQITNATKQHRCLFEGAFFSAQAHIRNNVENSGKLLSLYREARHYSTRSMLLVWFIGKAIEDCRNNNEQAVNLIDRISIDVEMLTVNVRAFMDAIYGLFSNENFGQFLKIQYCELPNKRRKSYGSFAEWFKELPDDKKKIIQNTQPISFFCDLSSWGLTIRTLRDSYVHQGNETAIYIDDDVYIQPSWWGYQSIPRHLPDSLYGINVNNKEYVNLERFVVYLMAPVLALKTVFGKYLIDQFSTNIPDWHNCYPESRRCTSWGIDKMHDLLVRHKDALNQENYKFELVKM